MLLNMCMVYRNWSRHTKCHQIVVYGATPTCKNRGSMAPVHILMDPVHGPGPRRGSMDQGSMFCTFPLQPARLAQSVEHETLNLRVVGSSPTLGAVILSFDLTTYAIRLMFHINKTEVEPDSFRVYKTKNTSPTTEYPSSLC